ncbi:MAG TPA: PAS domain S-box protein [Sediminibacterium sp.]|nr:PAS domain S-box protein [Sediminibacterium sp.]
MKKLRDSWYVIVCFLGLLGVSAMMLWETKSRPYNLIGRFAIIQFLLLLLAAILFFIYFRRQWQGSLIQTDHRYLDQIRISNERYSLVSRATNDCIWDWNLVTNRVYRDDKKLETLLGYPAWEPEEVDKQWRLHVHPDDWQQMTAARATIFNDPEQNYWEGRYRFLRPDGSYAFVSDRGYIIRDSNGKAIRMIGASNDISQRIQAEKELVSSEKRFRSLVEKGSEIIVLHDRNGIIQYISPSSLTILGFHPEERVQHSGYENVHPEDIPVLRGRLEKLMAIPGAVSRAQWRHRHRDGSWRWMDGVATNLLEDPAVQAVVHNFRDITEQKEAEERLLAEKESLDSFINSLPGIFYCFDKNGRFIRWNRNLADVSGYTDTEIAAMHPLQFIAEADKPLVSSKIAEVFEKGFAETEAAFQLQNGFTIPYYFNGKMVLLKGEPCLVGMGLDITVRKQNEEKLQLLQSVVTNANDGVLITEAWPIEGTGPKIVYVNEAFSRIVGFSADELLGATPRVLQGKDTDRAKLTQIREALLTQKPVQLELLNYRKDGTPFWTYISISPVKNNLGECTHFISIQNDITERKLQEKEMQEQKAELQALPGYLQHAREEERRFIAREVHDELGQLATAIKIDIDWLLLQPYFNNEQAVRRANHAASVIEVLISSIRQIAHRIRPSVLDDFGLVAALKMHCDEFSKLTNTAVSLQANIDDKNLSPVFSTEVFRIVQESMTNIMRHAKATHVTIILQEKGQIMYVTVKDDGIGFDTKLRKNTLGLIGLRERAVYLDGQLQIDSQPGQGTTITASFPRMDET